MSIQQQLEILRDRIDRAARRSGRTADAITLVAVTKTVSPEWVCEAVEAGVRHIGENRVQEALAKQAALASLPLHWHLIGHLQRNKAKHALSLFEWIHSLDSLRLMETLERQAASLDREVDVLIQVNTSGEASKFGVASNEVRSLAERAGQCEHLRVRGLMTIGPLVGGPEGARASFRQLREIRDQLAEADLPGVEMRYLSMGMTGDFEIAIEEEANIIRVGSAIFGRRDE